MLGNCGAQKMEKTGALTAGVDCYLDEAQPITHDQHTSTLRTKGEGEMLPKQVKNATTDCSVCTDLHHNFDRKRTTALGGGYQGSNKYLAKYRPSASYTKYGVSFACFRCTESWPGECFHLAQVKLTSVTGT